MVCQSLAIKLVASTISLWQMTGVPVEVCTYEIAGIRWDEKQLGLDCDKQPHKPPPPHVIQLASINACKP